MPASTTDTVTGVIVFDEPVALPTRLEAVVTMPGPDPATWTVPSSSPLELRGLFELWRGAFMHVVTVGDSEHVRAVEELLAADGRTVDLHAGWLDQAATVATAEHAMSVIPTDNALFGVAERLRQLGSLASRHHRGVTFTVAPAYAPAKDRPGMH